MPRLAVAVATHQPASLPADPMYLPVQVGAATATRSLGVQRDDVGAHVSDLNPTLCELTALYWLWHHVEADYLGLCHYRRLFAATTADRARSRVLSTADALAVLDPGTVVVARRRHYVVETVESHYRHAHVGADLDLLRDVVGQRQAAYVPALERVLAHRSLSLYNMCLMPAPVLDRYCTWLFDVLLTLEPAVGWRERTGQDRRVLGFLGERLLNVWLLHHADDLRVRHLPVVHLEGEHRLRRGAAMLRRRLA